VGRVPRWREGDSCAHWNSLRSHRDRVADFYRVHGWLPDRSHKPYSISKNTRGIKSTTGRAFAIFRSDERETIRTWRSAFNEQNEEGKKPLINVEKTEQVFCVIIFNGGRVLEVEISVASVIPRQPIEHGSRTWCSKFLRVWSSVTPRCADNRKPIIYHPYFTNVQLDLLIGGTHRMHFTSQHYQMIFSHVPVSSRLQSAGQRPRTSIDLPKYR